VGAALPTGIRARAVGFVYAWSWFSATFTAFIIAFVLERFGVTGVFVLRRAMAVMVLMVGLMGPRTRNIVLETISH
jgi:MFS transporter, putative metabolite:H+ symporter